MDYLGHALKYSRKIGWDDRLNTISKFLFQNIYQLKGQESSQEITVKEQMWSTLWHRALLFIYNELISQKQCFGFIKLKSPYLRNQE